MNPLFIPTLALAVGAYWVGHRLMRRVLAPGHPALPAGEARGDDPTRRGRDRRCRWSGAVPGALAGAVALAVPAVLYTVYYLHLFDNAVWFYELRAMPGSELLAAGSGVLAGMLQAFVPRRRILFAATVPLMLALLLGWLTVPFVKSLVLRADLREFKDEWVDGVCVQSTSSSCGPASAATLLRAAGYRVTERELARESFASITGTENWYLARALRRRGLSVRYEILPPDPDRLPCPSIAGVWLGRGPGKRPGHFIAVLEETTQGYVIGDPLGVRTVLRKDDRETYHFTGFFMLVEPNPRAR